jgi:hypothetical protein
MVASGKQSDLGSMADRGIRHHNQPTTVRAPLWRVMVFSG